MGGFDFSGVMTALITPMRADGSVDHDALTVTPMRADGSVDHDALTALVERQIAAGVSALVPCGTTGETPTLTHDEQIEVVRTTIQAAAGRVPIIAGAGANSTAKACELVAEMTALGAAATLQVSPYYNKPTQGGLVAHFTAAADASDRPIVLYNIPGRTSVRMELATILELAQHPRVAAIKEATGDAVLAAEIKAGAPDLALLAGDDAMTLPLAAVGGQGVISVSSNLVPAEMVELVRCANAGDFAGALGIHQRLLPLWRALFAETNPIPIKAAMAAAGHCTDHVRLPLMTASESTREKLNAALVARV
jgi:4-hydroxy-tetrahydrodipicolinate synthase